MVTTDAPWGTRYGAAAVVNDGKIVFTGGQSSTSLDDVWFYNRTTQTSIRTEPSQGMWMTGFVGLVAYASLKYVVRG